MLQYLIDEFTVLDGIAIVLVLALVIWAFFFRAAPTMNIPDTPKLPPMSMADLTIAELRKYDGVQDKRIMFALNGTIYDVSRGRSFYGPGCAYSKITGHDATVALGKMSVDAVSDEWLDHESLTPEEKSVADDWELSFKAKYPSVGRLVRNDADKRDYGGHAAEVLFNKTMDDFVAGSEDKKND